jgi:hypothetical protein
MRTYQELCYLFEKLEIDYSQPGFYDSPSFVESEGKDARFLENYADFIISTKYDEEYLSNARNVVSNLANFLASELKEDGLQGACVNLSGAMSRMLDKEGIWNFVITGCLALEFHPKTSLPIEDREAYFYSITPYTNVGHAWLYAPPFSIVDLTIAAQNYSEMQKQLLPCLILQEEEPTRILLKDISVRDLIHPDDPYVSFLREHSNASIDLLDRLPGFQPGLADRVEKYGAFQLNCDAVNLRYISNGVTATDCSLEGIRNIQLRGKYPNEIYEQYQRLKNNPSPERLPLNDRASMD